MNSIKKMQGLPIIKHIASLSCLVSPEASNQWPGANSQPPDASSQQPVTSSQKPATSNQRPVARGQLPADMLIPQLSRQTPTRRKWYCILMILLGCLLWTSAAATGITEEALPDAFTDVIGKLSSLTDRSTGTAGNQEAALYIKEKLEQLGYSDLGSYRFSVPVMRNEKSTLILANRNIQIDLHPISGNAVTPQTVAPPGLSGPLIYAGRGELKHLNAKQIADSIILMELDSGKNWLQAANLGASALIYIDRGESPKIFFEEKFELSPLQFPRFWISRAQAKEVFGDFENAPGGQIAAEAQLTSRIRWQLASSENIYCFVTGTDPMLKERLIMVEAFYDSTPTVAGLSPGADEAV
ncbi:MAG: hypothetical protein KAI86_09830, partial [Desulfobacterales bacterium]|nr:hypothetical protein [Desulfobacterales bacterium]